MFPFQRSGELSFQIGDSREDQDPNNMENNNDSARIGSNINRGRGRRGGRKSSTLATTSNYANNDDYENKKTIHREIERQRRQEMSNLYTSLRSTLPDEYIRGKRSTSDHLGEAVNYIKYLEKNVKELGEKRDQLRKSQESSSSKFEEGGGSSDKYYLPGSVVIHQVMGGLHIEINVGCENEEFLLSSALQIVLEEGLSVETYTSTRINERLSHQLVCEVSGITCIDVSRLQQRLADLIS